MNTTSTELKISLISTSFPIHDNMENVEQCTSNNNCRRNQHDKSSNEEEKEIILFIDDNAKLGFIHKGMDLQ